MRKIADSIPGRGCTDLICTVEVALREYCPIQGGGNGQSIELIVSDAIVRSWLWCRSFPFGYFSSNSRSSRIYYPQTVVVDSPLWDS